jgi:hypothetical protein
MEQRKVKITAGDVQVTATLDSRWTADLVWDALPITASGSTWGDEIYRWHQVPKANWRSSTPRAMRLPIVNITG